MSSASFVEQDIMHDLRGLVSASAGAAVLDAWAVGEQEGALGLLVSSLAERKTGVTEVDRARLAAVAERWGTLEALSAALGALPAANEQDPIWETVEGTQRAALIEEELVREIAPDHVLAGRVLVVWLASARSDDLLVRVYPREAWGAGWPACGYAIVHPTWRGSAEPPAWPTARVFDSVYEALAAFAARCEM